ncbi:ABC transporter substrate-binding protein [Pseudonocardia sulfidoxydans]|uniref:ABC transporter substrate-binding protein n=1 Tax=Pseudonocardia sulfidoxydans TaxID=54011 RepID=UPI0011BE849B
MDLGAAVGGPWSTRGTEIVSMGRRRRPVVIGVFCKAGPIRLLAGSHRGELKIVGLIQTTRGRAGRRVGTALAGLALAATLAACGSSDEQSGTASAKGVTDTQIVLGGTAPLTGPVAASCLEYTESAEAWFKHVNDKGGVNGRQIVWDPLDDAYDLVRAGANARTLVDSDIFAIFGGCGSIQPPVVEQQAEKAKVPYLFPTAFLPALYNPVQQYTFAQFPSYGTQLVSLVPYAFDKYGKGTVGAVMLQTPGIDQALAEIKKDVQEAGAQYVDSDYLTATTSDFTPFVLKLKQANPDYVLTNLPPANMLQFEKAAQAQGFAPGKAYLNAQALASAQFTDPLMSSGKNLLGGKVLATVATASPEDPTSAECAAAITQYAPKYTVNYVTLAGCTGAVFMTSVLQKMGDDLTRDNLIATLQGLKDVSLAPNALPVTLTAQDHLATKKVYVVQLGDDGKWQQQGSVDIDTNF